MMSKLKPSPDYVMKDEDDRIDQLYCTICYQDLNHHAYSIESHPFLHIPLCYLCLEEYNTKLTKLVNIKGDENSKHSSRLIGYRDADVVDDHLEDVCIWCLDGGDLFVCDICSSNICKSCIANNFDDQFVLTIESMETWKCFICDDRPMANLIDAVKLGKKRSIYGDDDVLKLYASDLPPIDVDEGCDGGNSDEFGDVVYQLRILLLEMEKRTYYTSEEYKQKLVQDIRVELKSNGIDDDKFVPNDSFQHHLNHGCACRIKEAADQQLNEHERTWTRHFDILQRQEAELLDRLESNGFDIKTIPEYSIPSETYPASVEEEVSMLIRSRTSTQESGLANDDCSEDANEVVELVSEEDDRTSYYEAMQAAAEHDPMILKYDTDEYADLKDDSYPPFFDRLIPPKVLKAYYHSRSEDDVIASELKTAYNIPKYIGIILDHLDDEYQPVEWSFAKNVHISVLRALQNAKTPASIEMLVKQFRLPDELAGVDDLGEENDTRNERNTSHQLKINVNDVRTAQREEEKSRNLSSIQRQLMLRTNDADDMKEELQIQRATDNVQQRARRIVRSRKSKSNRNRPVSCASSPDTNNSQHSRQRNEFINIDRRDERIEYSEDFASPISPSRKTKSSNVEDCHIPTSGRKRQLDATCEESEVKESKIVRLISSEAAEDFASETITIDTSSSSNKLSLNEYPITPITDKSREQIKSNGKRPLESQGTAHSHTSSSIHQTIPNTASESLPTMKRSPGPVVVDLTMSDDDFESDEDIIKRTAANTASNHRDHLTLLNYFSAKKKPSPSISNTFESSSKVLLDESISGDSSDWTGDDDDKGDRNNEITLKRLKKSKDSWKSSSSFMRKNTMKSLSVDTKKRKREYDRRMSMTKSWEHYPENNEEGDQCFTINFTRPAKDQPVRLIKSLVDVLKNHQKEALRFIWEQVMGSFDDIVVEKEGSGCIIAHCMGLGKTLTIIAFVSTILTNPNIMSLTRNNHKNDKNKTSDLDSSVIGPNQPPTNDQETNSNEHDEFFDVLNENHPQPCIKRVLIVAPVNTIQNWISEFKRFIPQDLRESIPIHSFSFDQGGNKQSIATDRLWVLESWFNKGGVMMIGYHLFMQLTMKNAQRERFREYLHNPGPDLVIADEAHIMRNKSSQFNKALALIRTQRRIALTGSPLQNNLLEYWCMVNWVKERYLYTEREFRSRFVKPITAGQSADSIQSDRRCMRRRIHVLYKRLEKIVDRKDVGILLKDLPPKREFVIILKQTPVQRFMFDRFWKINLGKNGDDVKSTVLGAVGGLRRISANLGLLVLNLDYNTSVESSIIPVKTSAPPERPTLSYIARRLQEPYRRVENYLKQSKSMKLSIQSAKDERTVTRIDEIDEQILSQVSNEVDEPMLISTPTDNDNMTKKTFDRVSGPLIDDMIEIDDNDSDIDVVEKPPRAEKLDRTVIPRDWWTREPIAEGVCDSTGLQPLTVQELLSSGPKIIFFLNLLVQCCQSGDKMLLFSLSLEALDFIELILQSENWDEFLNLPGSNALSSSAYSKWIHGRNYFRLDGSTTQKDRQSYIRKFNTDEQVKLFMISVKAGGMGINLYSANRVVILDCGWNPTDDMQAIARSYRYGQVKPVFVYRLVAKRTLEERMYRLQLRKEALAKRVIDAQMPDNLFKDQNVHYDFHNAASDDEIYEVGQVIHEPAHSGVKKELIESLMIGNSVDHCLLKVVQRHVNMVTSIADYESFLEDNVELHLNEEEKKEAEEEYARILSAENVSHSNEMLASTLNERLQTQAQRLRSVGANQPSYSQLPAHVQRALLQSRQRSVTEQPSRFTRLTGPAVT